jgi:hypothetical protein
MTAEPTDTDRQRAKAALAYPAVRDDIDRVAQALADERERALAPVRDALAWFDRDGYVLADLIAAVRRAAGQQP